MNSNIEKVIAKLSKEMLTGNQVADILDNPKAFPTHFIEKVSLETALKYWKGQINYQDGDCIMNNIYAFWASSEKYTQNCAFPVIAWECYLAFDSGEYYREDDDRSIDPAERYTRPLVQDLLRRQKQIV